MKNYKDYFDTETGNWQIVKNDSSDSWWEYKSDAIDRVLEILGNPDGFEFEGEELSLEELKYKLEDMSEEDFYTTLEDIKNFVDYEGDIKLYNISDEDELEFLKDDETFPVDFD
jgi:hypothetical protein